MGRRPDPAGLQEAKGNPGKRRRTPVQPVPGGGTIAAPTRMTAEGQRVWDRLVPELVRMNFLRATDVQAFGRYCDAVARYWKITLQLRKVGETYTSKSNHGDLQRISPLFVVEERLAKRLESLEDRFGLNPAARQQIMLRLASAQGQLDLGRPPPEPEREASAPEASPSEGLSASPIGLLTPPARLN